MQSFKSNMNMVAQKLDFNQKTHAWCSHTAAEQKQQLFFSHTMCSMLKGLEIAKPHALNMGLQTLFVSD